jgi:hypothetical protein
MTKDTSQGRPRACAPEPREVRCGIWCSNSLSNSTVKATRAWERSVDRGTRTGTPRIVGRHFLQGNPHLGAMTSSYVGSGGSEGCWQSSGSLSYEGTAVSGRSHRRRPRLRPQGRNERAVTGLAAHSWSVALGSDSGDTLGSSSCRSYHAPACSRRQHVPGPAIGVLLERDRLSVSPSDKHLSVPGAWALPRGDRHLPSPAGRWFRRPRARAGHAAGES